MARAGYIHLVNISLPASNPPGLRYHYRCGDGSADAASWSPVFNFSLTRDVYSKPTRVGIQGDMGTIVRSGCSPAAPRHPACAHIGKPSFVACARSPRAGLCLSRHWTFTVRTR